MKCGSMVINVTPIISKSVLLFSIYVLDSSTSKERAKTEAILPCRSSILGQSCQEL